MIRLGHSSRHPEIYQWLKVSLSVLRSDLLQLVLRLMLTASQVVFKLFLQSFDDILRYILIDRAFELRYIEDLVWCAGRLLL